MSKRKIILYASTSAILISIIGCIHLSIGVDRKFVPDVVEKKLLSNQEAHPIEHITYEKEVEFPDAPPTEKEIGEVQTYHTVKLGPRFETQKERDLKWEIEGLEVKIESLVHDHATLIKKFNEFMVIHNQTVQELTSKVLPVNTKPVEFEGLLTREELEAELELIVPLESNTDVLEKELIESELNKILGVDTNEVIFDDDVGE